MPGKRVAILAVALTVVGFTVLRSRCAAWWPRPVTPRVSVNDNGIRVSTWNLRNFPGKTHDLGQIRDTFDRIDADVVALQEIQDPALLPEILPDFELRVSHGGGRGNQHVALAFDPRVLTAVGEVHEVDSLTLGGRVRPGLWLRLRPLDGTTTFAIFVVHLKATVRGYDDRREQWTALAAATRAIPEGTLIVLGDFNTVGGSGHTAGDERRVLAEVLADAALQPLATDLACTAYWQGATFDTYYEASILDAIWMRGVIPRAQAHVAGACARHRCRPIRSSRAYPDRDLDRVSDHCPLWWDLVDLAP